MASTANYYQILGVNSDASAAEIKRAFHRLAFKYHPDHHPEDPQSAQQFRIVNEAYQTLSNPQLRSNYDRLRGEFSYSGTAQVAPYIEVSVDLANTLLNEEVELIYRFNSEGRSFKKPILNDWMITNGPLVNHREIYRNGKEVRETSLHYTICPLKTGRLIIPAAHIRYDGVQVYSTELEVFVEGNQCFFKKGFIAGKSPLIIPLYREYVISTARYKKTIIQQRKVLIPRSDLSAWYHKTASIIKIGFTFCGMAYALVNDQNWLLGAMCGSLFGGINVQIMYKLMNIRPVWLQMYEFPAIKEYIQIGYNYGNHPDQLFTGSKLRTFVKHLLY
jgi:hypothetical protein